MTAIVLSFLAKFWAPLSGILAAVAAALYGKSKKAEADKANADAAHAEQMRGAAEARAESARIDGQAARAALDKVQNAQNTRDAIDAQVANSAASKQLDKDLADGGFVKP